MEEGTLGRGSLAHTLEGSGLIPSTGRMWFEPQVVSHNRGLAVMKFQDSSGYTRRPHFKKKVKAKVGLD